MYYSLNSLKGFIWGIIEGTTIGVTKDIGVCGLKCAACGLARASAKGLGFGSKAWRHLGFC